ncbi:hypothetical protein PQR05_37970 [Paraburkholderia sediminicola]|uniref:hypothetical protein n=1 Tax=Paraburkholderia sediminicola TaxID=458836 RepID=UPI0038BB5B97
MTVDGQQHTLQPRAVAFANAAVQACAPIANKCAATPSGADYLQQMRDLSNPFLNYEKSAQDFMNSADAYLRSGALPEACQAYREAERTFTQALDVCKQSISAHSSGTYDERSIAFESLCHIAIQISVAQGQVGWCERPKIIAAFAAARNSRPEAVG